MDEKFFSFFRSPSQVFQEEEEQRGGDRYREKNDGFALLWVYRRNTHSLPSFFLFEGKSRIDWKLIDEPNAREWGIRVSVRAPAHAPRCVSSMLSELGICARCRCAQQSIRDASPRARRTQCRGRVDWWHVKGRYRERQRRTRANSRVARVCTTEFPLEKFAFSPPLDYSFVVNI